MPVAYVSVPEDKESFVLATFDAITLMATFDTAALTDLLVDAGSTDVPELDDLLSGLADYDMPDTDDDGVEGQDNDEIPDMPEGEPVTQPGDIWQLGPHRIMCGDSRNPADVATLLNGQQINLAFTSPPYADRRKYDETTEFKPVPPDEYVEWFKPVQANVAEHLTKDGSWFINIASGAENHQKRRYVLDLVLAHMESGWLWIDEYQWAHPVIPTDPKTSRRFKPGSEPIYSFSKTVDYKFNPDGVRHPSERVPIYSGRETTISTDYQGVSGRPEMGRKAGLAYPSTVLTMNSRAEALGHAATFPVGLPDFFVRAYTDEGDTVYDPFMGSGSTLLAADQNSRIGYGMEISPKYCDVICARYQKATGTLPVLESTGNRHNFVGVEPETVVAVDGGV